MENEKETIRVSIVGAGENTRKMHIPGLQAIPGVEIVGVANRRRESAGRVAGEFGIPTVYNTWESLVSAQDSDAIVIGTWPYLHCPVTLTALDAGKHVLCEARMAMDAAEAREMLAVSQRYPDLVAQVVPSPMTLGVDQTVSRLVKEGFLGRLFAVEVRDYAGAFVDEDAPMHWRQDVRLSGKNVMTLGIWYEAVMRWVGGAKNVMAKGQVNVGQRLDGDSGELSEVEVPDHLVVVADMECGAQATFQVSQVVGGVQAGEVVLSGSEGTLKVCDGRLYGIQRGESGFQEIPVPEKERGGWRVEEEFIRAIRGEEVVTHTTFADGVSYMEFTDAVARSMADGRVVDVAKV